MNLRMPGFPSEGTGIARRNKQEEKGEGRSVIAPFLFFCGNEADERRYKLGTIFNGVGSGNHQLPLYFI